MPRYLPNAPIEKILSAADRASTKRLNERRDALNDPSQSTYQALIGMTDGTSDSAVGASVTPERAMKQVAFFRCVSILAQTIASTEMFVYARTGRRREIVLDDPRYDLVHDDPNPEMTAFHFWQYIVTCICIWGNAYAWIETDTSGNVIALWPIQPGRITPAKSPTGAKIWVVYFGDGEQSVLLADEVMAFHGVGLEANRGLAPYQQLRDELGISMAATDYAGRLFQNFAVPGGVYSTDKRMDDAQYNEFLARQKAAHEGLRNSHRMAVLPPGMTYTESNFDPGNLQMVDARIMQTKMVAMLFGIPPRMLGINDGTASYSSVEQDSINFVTHTLRPWFMNLEQSVRKALFAFPADKVKRLFVEFDATPLLVPDSISRAKVDASDRLYGVKNADEIREDRGLDPLPNNAGKRYWMPANMTPIDEEGLPLVPANPEQDIVDDPTNQPALPNPLADETPAQSL